VFTLGGSEFLIIVVIALLLFGPDKIPQLARTVGRFTREFNKYKDIMESTIRMEIAQAEGPTKDELTVEQRIAKASAASQAVIDAERESVALEGADAETEESAGADSPVHASPAPAADEADEEDEE
jgi:TatA/E family protein of Tat protein translocase